MGVDKAGYEIAGKTMLQRVTDALTPVATGIALLGTEHAGYECWPDQVAASGPLAGITTALRRSPYPRVLLVAVDNAFVRTETLAHLAETPGDLPVVPVDEHGVRQVTCAVYPTSIAEQAFEEALSGGSIQSLLDRVSFYPVTPPIWKEWAEDGRSWFSADTPEAVDRGLALYG